MIFSVKKRLDQKSPLFFKQGTFFARPAWVLRTLDEDGFRIDLEENFLDDKSAGFQLESSKIRTADALARLSLILAQPRSIW